MKSFRTRQDFYRKSLWFGLLVCSMGMPFAHAQNQSIEERLRSQLRSTNAELQQVRGQLAAAEAARAELIAMEKAVAQLKADLATERTRGDRLSASSAQIRRDAQDTLQKALQQAGQYRTAHQDVLQVARSAETERVRLAGELAASNNGIRQCVAQNAALYSLGREILAAYEQIDVATVIAARQPFADRSRVKFDEIAQKYGDRLYQGKFDARATGTADSAAARQPDTSTR